MSLALLLLVASPLNESPDQMGRRLHDCVANRDAECLYVAVVREERVGHGLDLAQYKKLMSEYVFPFLGPASGKVEVEPQDARTNKLYGQWAYGIEATATRYYATKSGGRLKLSFDIVGGSSKGYQASGVIGSVLDSVYASRRSRESTPSPVEATRSRYLTLKEDSPKLTKFGLAGTWSSPQVGRTPWPKAIETLKSQLKGYGVEVD